MTSGQINISDIYFTYPNGENYKVNHGFSNWRPIAEMARQLDHWTCLDWRSARGRMQYKMNIPAYEPAGGAYTVFGERIEAWEFERADREGRTLIF